MTNTTTTTNKPILKTELKLSPHTASIQIIPKPDELNDTNMPRNLHNAAELFLRLGMVPAANNVRDNTNSLFSLYATDPDGRKGLRVGTACVCWACGFCGLPGEGKGEVEEEERHGPCGACGEVEQVNRVKVFGGGGGKEELPWIEEARHGNTEENTEVEEEKKKKRAEVERKVKEAMEERARKGGLKD